MKHTTIYSLEETSEALGLPVDLIVTMADAGIIPRMENRVGAYLFDPEKVRRVLPTSIRADVDALFPTTEAADRLGVSAHTLRRMARSRKLPAVRRDNRYFFDLFLTTIELIKAGVRVPNPELPEDKSLRKSK